MAKDVLKIEKVQNYFSRRVFARFGLGHPDPAERNKVLGLESLELRRIKSDLVMIYKIIFEEVALDRAQFFEWAPEVGTRRRCFKIDRPFSRLDLRRKSFACRLISVWNELPEFIYVDQAGSLTQQPLIRAKNCRLFKNRLDKVDLPGIINKVTFGHSIS
ncbi:MAG: hypothetical protein GY696_35580 [Gammaproteobacteria bacterium]|nr:hypothetical protein [Gammaproteobacteria bacterium]